MPHFVERVLMRGLEQLRRGAKCHKLERGDITIYRPPKAWKMPKLKAAPMKHRSKASPISLLGHPVR